jgi:hypothetical protein
MTTSTAPRTYTAICKQVGKWWEITVPELDEVTQARHLDDVPATVADLVALMTDADPSSVEVNVKAHAGPGLDMPFLLKLAVGAAVAYAVLRRLPLLRRLLAVAYALLRRLVRVPSPTLSPLT